MPEAAMWKMSSLGRLHALWILLAHVRNPATLREMWKARGEGFPLFGGEAVCSFANVKGLMEREPEKLPGIYCPMEDEETFFSQGYMPFLQKNPNHAARRAYVIERVEGARARLPEMEALLRGEPSEEHAIAHFLLLTLGGIEPTAQEVDDMVFFRKHGPILAFFPRWLRDTVLRSKYQRAIAIRKQLLDRFTAAGNSFPDTCMEAIWFNAGTLGFYPEKALDAVKQDAALAAEITPEIGAEPQSRPKMRALIMEMLRLHSRIASVNYLVDGKPTIALIATAVMDPARFENPEKVDLTRDHSDSVSFALPSPQRSCPGKDLAPEIMAAVLAHMLRKAAA
jgi:hypothetical protein